MRLYNLTVCVHHSLFTRAPDLINPPSMHAGPVQCGGRNHSPALSSVECMQSSCYLMHELLHFPSWLAMREKGRWSGIKCSAHQNNYTGQLEQVTAAGWSPLSLSKLISRPPWCRLRAVNHTITQQQLRTGMKTKNVPPGYSSYRKSLLSQRSNRQAWVF